MKKIAIVFAIFIAICVVAGVSSSCSRNVFDYDTYDSIVEIKSPVDTVDPNHTWTLSTKKFVIITVNGNVGAKKLQVLTDDPTTSKKAAVLAQNIVEEGDRFSMNHRKGQHLAARYRFLESAGEESEADVYT